MGLSHFLMILAKAGKYFLPTRAILHPSALQKFLNLPTGRMSSGSWGHILLVISVDRMASHKSWKAELESIDYKGRSPVKIDFPFCGRQSAVISHSYGMIDSKTGSGQSIRGVFFVDPDNEIRAFHFYPSEVGRSTDEIVRTLKALQAQQSRDNIVMPANWQPGDDVMIPILTKEDKEELQTPESKIHYINWYMIFRKQD
jgi:peroxiredoxin 2/4